ncbi:transglycosylase SLT domain-containing protein [Oscillatoria sp. FACHB-1407]|uniref:transglycosylase SLT domain-containing protein n=1 Tax=Oscillatoria sp. FACHB-1407 TaxID=2692847 RepID=UPI001684F4EF|nr:transglycosylase SLT domain-containing protein [Oscillatoria sp. FACHB-1407]MBD2462816.1 transglycosylase SLT domain-containing protein [Oscillatoria sp. FACHB-1407]
MLKQPKRTLLITAGAGVLALALGGATAAALYPTWISRLPIVGQWIQPNEPSNEFSQASESSESSVVLSLVSLSPAERAAQLEAIATQASSTDQYRARYLLAMDLINQNRGGAALPLLEGLEQDYPVLAPAVLAKRAQAYTASAQPEQATATWQALLQQFPDSPFAAEALYALGQTDAQALEQLLTQFPAHGRAIALAQERLAQNPNQPQLLLLLARYGLHLNDGEAALDRLVNEYASTLPPQDWEAIAFGYWELQRYSSASDAYAKAPATPLGLYRVGRGAWLGDRTQDAIAAYRVLIQQFPDAPETGLGLLRLSRLVEPQEALSYTDQIISRFPDRAPEALLERAKALDALGSAESASQARQSLLTQYSSSDAAAELRWTLAEQRMEAGDLRGAWELARQLVKDNPDSEYAPEAAFWLGKWAHQSGQPEAQAAFEYVLTHYPDSYYAWRSAVYLGWDNVGDFTSVRAKVPEVITPTQRPTLPAGSELLQELYRLGQNQDTWSVWQVEFQNRMTPTVAEQFTDGVLRLGVGDHLEGIFMVSSLANRETPEERSQYKALKQQPFYWQALYPFLYSQPIQNWSKERQLNPLLVTALIRQESRFEPNIRSVVGAIGLMQVMPDTGVWISETTEFPNYNLDNPDDNIRFGTWFLDYTHEEYSDNSLFAVASYNAGPGNVADWIARFGFSDPDIFVEQIPFPETKGYVESVFGNYWNYLRLYNPEVSQQLARYSPNHVEMVGQMP